MEKNSTGWLKMRSRDKESYHAEDKGRFETAFYKEILDQMPDMVLRVDSDLKVIWANEAVLKVNSDVYGKSCHEVFHQSGEACENCPCKRCLITGVIEKGVVALPDREGSGIRYWEIQGVPVKDSRGKVIAVNEISRDVTDRIESSHELQLRLETLENQIAWYQEETAKRFDFIHKLSADVKGDVEDMSDQLSYLKHLSELKSVDWLDPMLQLNEKTLRRVGNLSDLFALEERNIQLVYVPFEVTELIDEIYNRFKHRARERNINLEVHQSRTVPKKLIGDLFRMNGILMNILENSITHTQNGNIKVYFYAQSKAEDGAIQMQIVVSDTGMGLTDDRLAQIQALLKDEDAKHYLDQAIEMKGLGLLMVHNTLKVMGGFLEIDSQYGRGTTVKLNFKMGFKSEKVEHKYREMVHEDGRLSGEAKSAQRRMILIAEDEVVGRVTYKIHLQEHFDLIFAKNGKEAVELYLSEKPDLVFMDIMMPVLNGLEAFDEIEKHRRHRVPIIACTAKVIDSERDYLLTYGFSDYLSKPVDASSLMRMVAKHLK